MFSFFKFFGINDSISKGFVIILLGLLAFIVIPNAGQIYERLGFETKDSLSKKLEAEKIKTDKVIEANKVTDATIEISKTIDEIKDQIAVQSEVTKEAIEVTKDTIIVEKRKKADDIKKNEKKKPTVDSLDLKMSNAVTATTDVPEYILEASKQSGESVTDVRLSENNIDAIWKSFEQLQPKAI